MNRSSRSLRLILTTSLALAVALAIAPWAPAATPVERHQVWSDALQQVLDSNSQLTPEQVSTIHAAIREVDAGDFTDRLDPADRELFDRQVEALASNLSCSTYGAVVEGLGDLSPWLAANEVVVAPDKCNCSAHEQCGDEYYCASVECISEVGTQNWGRCKKGPRPVETDPDASGGLSLDTP